MPIPGASTLSGLQEVPRSFGSHLPARSFIRYLPVLVRIIPWVVPEIMNLRPLFVVFPGWFHRNEPIKILEPLLVRLCTIQLSPQPVPRVRGDSADNEGRRVFAESLGKLPAALLPLGFVKVAHGPSRIEFLTGDHFRKELSNLGVERGVRCRDVA